MEPTKQYEKAIQALTKTTEQNLYDNKILYKDFICDLEKERDLIEQRIIKKENADLKRLEDELQKESNKIFGLYQINRIKEKAKRDLYDNDLKYTNLIRDFKNEQETIEQEMIKKKNADLKALKNQIQKNIDDLFTKE